MSTSSESCSRRALGFNSVVHRLTRTQARRIAVRAQLLDAHRPDDLHEAVHHLTHVQHDLTAAVAASADLVLWGRLGPSYSSEDLTDALDEQSLVDVRGEIRPAEDLKLYRADMADWPGRGPLKPWQEEIRDWVRANESCRLDILERLRGDGPLPAGELPDTCVVPWRSSGWNHHRNVAIMLDLMVQRGEVAAAGRDGRERLWDLAQRIYPDEPVVPADEARTIRASRALHALGLARSREVGEAGEPATVEGVRGTWRVDPAYLDGPFSGRAAVLSPLDRLVYDRKRIEELFEFDYQLEMYKPAAKRRWGYWAMPILYGDRLVGKVDATAERDAGVLRVDAIHQDVPFGPTMAAKVEAEVGGLARWLGLVPEFTG